MIIILYTLTAKRGSGLIRGEWEVERTEIEFASIAETNKNESLLYNIPVTGIS